MVGGGVVDGRKLRMSDGKGRYEKNAVDFGGRGRLHVFPLTSEPICMSDPNPLSSLPGDAGPLGEISQAPPAFEAFLDKHQMKLIVLAVILAIGAIAYVVVDGIQDGAEKAAGGLLVKAEDVSDLEKIPAEHAGTAAAFSAKILLAEKQWEKGDEDAAIDTLNAFVENSAEHPARSSAQASLAAKLWSQGKRDEASEIFEDIAGNEGSRYLAPYAWISLGDIRKENGDLEGAEKAYDNVEKEFSGTTFADQASRRKLLLGAAAPVQISSPIAIPDAKIVEETQKDAGLNPAQNPLENVLDPGAAESSVTPEFSE